MIKIDKYGFSIVRNSEDIENFDYSNHTIKPAHDNNANKLMQNISRDTILSFLDCEDTNLYLEKYDENEYELIAHNTIANESIKVKGLGNHFVAFAEAIQKSVIVKNSKRFDENYPILTNEFIKNINHILLSNNDNRKGIGEYRTVDEYGQPQEVAITKNNKLLRCVIPETSLNGNVSQKMNTLIEWVNNINLEDSTNNKLYNLAKFHADFIKIHPFIDGNGRTCRILTNYLASIMNIPLVNIPENAREEYIKALNYANATNDFIFAYENPEYNEYNTAMQWKYQGRDDQSKYLPLADLMYENQVANSNEIVSNILNYKSNNESRNLHADQIR